MRAINEEEWFDSIQAKKYKKRLGKIKNNISKKDMLIKMWKGVWFWLW